jgi:molybdate transport system substrate-binding protein
MPPAATPKGNGQLRIAAASDLQFALDEIIIAFERIHPAAAISVKYGSSGSFFAQLANEAPFDLFLSADVDYARRLVEQGHAAPNGDFSYARGHIVVWVLNDSPQSFQQPGLEFLRSGEVQKIAIANPKTAPYGRAAVAALKSLGVYDAVATKLVYGDSVAQAAQMVESGAADAGIIALSLVVSPALRDKGRYWQVPDGAHPPLVQGGVVLSWARDAPLAGEFRDFLLSGDGTSILRQFGFDTQ